ncbi:ABC transporter ATP-binding protein [Aliidongia dinghuensis]|uniref:ABC transporter ATP-binding protein n=1 Tax=Aliidongia dinghuensis TaxID=1867774 RepID=A0A8J2YSV3_9PROT|nr:ABC transporter ATP-binding protein [Aliidongia dinghuensis]GGF15549.1 ABC transporter ATP-binding protein [Aliidongia dinghuensis]
MIETGRSSSDLAPSGLAPSDLVAPTLPRLSLAGVTCAFGNYVAVDRLDLDIMPGEFVSLLGPSGCGKTTTLRMIAGFVKPTAGTIAMDGTPISSASVALPPEKRQMSMIFQSYAVWPNMTIGENVAFGLKLRRLDAETIAHKVREVLETVQLAHLVDRYPAELSGGQQQRVALARAIVVRPRVLLLDEPLSNLDANLREEMRYEIRRLHDAFDFTTVYVTHDQSEAMVTSDRIAVMNKGRIEQIDAPYTLYTRPRTRFVASFIGRTNLIEGTCEGDQIRFDGFGLPRGAFENGGRDLEASVQLSVRPQSVTLLRRPPITDARCIVRSALKERAFLGESWDYIVSPEGSGLRLRVAAVPSEVFEVGDTVWLALDPQQMTVVV